MNKTIINKLKSCGPQLKNKINLKAHLRIMVVVGTLLNLINQSIINKQMIILIQFKSTILLYQKLGYL